MITLRPYQQDLADQVYAAWEAGAKVVLKRLDTGGGKTAILGRIVQDHKGASCIIAHRTELVGQLSLTLARYGVRHDLIASAGTRKAVARAHIEEIGTCYYQPGARCAVASVDTLIKAGGLESWQQQVTLWIVDEGHHCARDWKTIDGERVPVPNKWGKAIEGFTNPAVRGLLPTATPKRADGKGLGSHTDGYADIMVEGPPMRWLIEQGYLCDYVVYCPPSDLQVAGVPGAGGDYSPAQLKEAAERSHIVGDLPKHYLRFGEDGTFIAFCTDVERAVLTAEAFRELGIAAEVVTGNTHDHVRRDIFRRFGMGAVRVICVVDIVSEGTDLPACRGASFGRPSESLSLVMQQIGRTLRPLYAPGFDLSTQAGRLAAIAASEKPYAILIDHVQHFTKPHLGPPDKVREWNLERRDKRGKTRDDDVIPNRVCTECIRPYPATKRRCPHCEHEPKPTARTSPEAVDGDLELLDPTVLAQLRGIAAEIELTPDERRAELVAARCPAIGIERHIRSHLDRQAAQMMLRAAMGRWGGIQLTAGLSDSEMQRAFYFTFGVDVLTARGMGATDAWALTERVDSLVNGG